MWEPFLCTASTTCCRPRQRVSPRGLWEATCLLPPGDLGVVPDTAGMRHPASLGRNESTLGDEERAGDAGALRVMFDDEVCRDVRGIVT